MGLLKRIKVTIVINGQELHGYDDEFANPYDRNSASKYVEATSSAQFEIKASALSSYYWGSNAVLMDISLDGVYIDNGLLLKKNARPDHAWDEVFEAARRHGSTGWECKPFTSAEVLSRK